MSENKPSKEQIDKWKSRVADPNVSEPIKETFRKLLEKWDKGVEEVEEAVGVKKERKPRASKPKAERKPRATKQTGEDVEKAKAEIKKRTGKTEEECEKIIEEYRSLRTKAQERKHQEEKATQDNKKRVEKLEKKGDIIEGTTEKTADAVIETAKVDVVEKIEKEIEKVEEKAEKEAKKEVEKEMPKKSATEKKEAIEKKVEKKVQEKTKVVVKRVVVDTSALLTSIADTLGKFDKDSQKEFLIKLRSDIDKLLSKYAFGGLTNGATQQMNITQSNLSSSSVNAIPVAGGGGVSYIKKWEVIGINLYGKKFKEVITLGRMSDKEDVKNALKRRTDLNIREVTSIKEIFAGGGGVRKVGGREYPFGSAWALEHNKVNKGEKHEVPSSQRRKKYVRGGGMSDAIKNRRGY